VNGAHVYLLVTAIFLVIVVSTSNSRPSRGEWLFYLAAVLWPVTLLGVVVITLLSFVWIKENDKGEMK